MLHMRDALIETADTSVTEYDKIRKQIRDTKTAANDFANAYVQTLTWSHEDRAVLLNPPTQQEKPQRQQAHLPPP